MTKQQWLIAGLGLAAVAALGWLWYAGTKAPEPAEPLAPLASSPLATTSAPATKAAPQETRPLVVAFSIDPVDTIASWDFKGAYTDNQELVAKAQSEIKRLSVLLETATSSAMILSVGIANQYELLGDGKRQYEYLGRAIMADVNVTSGLPWHNLGVLMERLGALETARVAHEKSTVIQPELKQWHYSYIEFLTSRMRDDTVHIEKAFAFAEKSIGVAPYLAELRAEWQKP